MLLSKGLGNFPRWCFRNPPKVLEGEKKGRKYPRGFTGEEIEVRRQSDGRTKGLLRGAADTTEFHVTP